MVCWLSQRQKTTCCPTRGHIWLVFYKGWCATGIYSWTFVVLSDHYGIVEEINSSIRLFADFFKLFLTFYIIVHDSLDSAIKLNADLSRIDMWASMWLVTFNPSKSESLIFSRKVNKPYHPPIYMNYQQVNEINSHKHLGIYMSRNCTWHEHIST